MRLQNVRDYVAWLLKETPGWDRDKIDATIASGEQVNVKLPDPVPVYWVYITAWGTPEGLIQFRDDIYQRDGLGAIASVAPPPSAGAPQPAQAGKKGRPVQQMEDDDDN
jgi:murein L,D-transpeptidase YcbB/YkuD